MTTIAAINATHNGNPNTLVTSTPIKAPIIKISPCAILMIPSTPNTRVNPRATMAYMLPSVIPLIICSNSKKSHPFTLGKAKLALPVFAPKH